VSAATLADALALAALPVELRRLVAAEIRRAYLAGWAARGRVAEDDARTGMTWGAVAVLPAISADLWIDREGVA
jgi:hypothetical protein